MGATKLIRVALTRFLHRPPEYRKRFGQHGRKRTRADSPDELPPASRLRQTTLQDCLTPTITQDENESARPAHSQDIATPPLPSRSGPLSRTPHKRNTSANPPHSRKRGRSESPHPAQVKPHAAGMKEPTKMSEPTELDTSTRHSKIRKFERGEESSSVRHRRPPRAHRKGKHSANPNRKRDRSVSLQPAQVNSQTADATVDPTEMPA